jgi:hypothetical protein
MPQPPAAPPRSGTTADLAPHTTLAPARAAISCDDPPALRDDLPGQICREADFVARLAEYYRTRFGQVIDRLNRNPSTAAGDLDCLRLCVEAVDVMLSSQSTLARAMKQISTARPQADAPLRAA